jgi:F-type H+-transporting ATPase subunit delta
VASADLSTHTTTTEQRYAQAILALADDRRQQDGGALDRIAADLEALHRLYREDPGFRFFVADPRLGATAQRSGAFGVMDRLGIQGEVRNMVGVMIANRRLSLLPGVAQAFAELLAARQGRQSAMVTSAHALTDTQRTQLVARLTEAGYSNVRLVEAVDPSILGGLIVRIGPRLYDNSIKSKLQRLQYAMKGAA